MNMKIENFNYEPDANSISLCIDGKLISIVCENLKSAYLYENVNTILALSGEGNSYSSLIGFSVEGERKFEVGPPDGFSFYYLTNHPKVEASVICVSEKYVDGWTDWYFSVDISNGNLTRLCPAY